MKIIRGSILTFTGDPFFQEVTDCFQYESDGALVIENGYISKVGNAAQVLASMPDDCPAKNEIHQYKDCLIIPGFIDSHVHYSQTQIIGAFGLQLLDWLSTYTFPAEQQFSSGEHAASIASFFLDELLRSGTTTCCAFCTVFPKSVEVFFQNALEQNMRVAAGKVCMDRNAPEGLLDTAQLAYDDSKALIEKWNGKGRLDYVITPRFAPTSTPQQLEALGALAREFPDMLIQSHISENIGEIEWVKSLFPDMPSYAAVYDHFGLVRSRSIYGHGVHLTEEEMRLLSERGASIAHCPTSNFFLGSGCLDVFRAKAPERPLSVGLATDLGAGTSFSLLQTMNEAYKAAQLSGQSLSAIHAFYLATKGSAEALGMEDKIGSLVPGMEADIVVLDLKSTPLIARRMEFSESLMETLFLQMTLADDRAVHAVYVNGERVVHKAR